jgi:hypothetical protein
MHPAAFWSMAMNGGHASKHCQIDRHRDYHCAGRPQVVSEQDPSRQNWYSSISKRSSVRERLAWQPTDTTADAFAAGLFMLTAII